MNREVCNHNKLLEDGCQQCEIETAVRILIEEYPKLARIINAAFDREAAKLAVAENHLKLATDALTMIMKASEHSLAAIRGEK